ncbi:MAG: carboxypeptidase-like regulatory domain-containing protein [Bacteroidetes bacterium]|nr:carboxypeptidase-like regulatory domain-containing protein [Bacteroidota bacterium]
MAELSFTSKIEAMLSAVSATEAVTLNKDIRSSAVMWNGINGQLDPAGVPHGTIGGTVDVGGTGLAAVKVIATSGDETYSATTDASGNYVLDCPAGTYTVLFGIVGYVTQSTASVVVATGATTDCDKTLVAV